MNTILLRIILIPFIGFCSITSFSQYWLHTYGGSYNDEGYSARQTFDGGYIITGYTSPVNAWSSDLWLIRTDGNGDTLWTKTYGGVNDEEGVDVQQTTDNGYIITGWTASFGTGNIDVWLLKTDSNGDTLWTKTFGGANNEFGNSVIQTADNGYLVIGSTDSFGEGGSDFWIVKTNSNGDSLWSKTYGGFYHDIAFGGQPTSDGGFILTGYTQQEGISNADVWLVKIENTGDTIWTQTFGGDLDDLAYSVQQTYDEGYIITGYTKSFGAGFMDLWLIKTDIYGDPIWTNTFGGTSNDAGHSVIETAESDFIVCGFTYSFSQSGDADMWLIKTDINGDTLWTHTYGGSYNEVGYSVSETFDGGLVVSGFTESYGAGDKDVWLLHLDANGQVGMADHPSLGPGDYKLSQNFPNPFSGETTIDYFIPNSAPVSLEVYDLSCKLLSTLVNEYQQAGSYSVRFENKQLQKGIYYFRLQSGNFDCTKKFILSR